MTKTNAIRLLENSQISFHIHEYDSNETNGVKVAQCIHAKEEEVFKTLVSVANTKEHFVFVIPVKATLNLKKAAKAVNVKSIELIKQKELLPLTGYVHGGCSPIGMKKSFTTIIDESALQLDKIYVSAGKVGLNMDINPIQLSQYIQADFKDVIDK